MSYIPQQTLAQTAFGELSVAEPTPTVQLLTQYGQLSQVTQFNINGTSGSTDGKFFAQSDTSANSLGSIVSARALTYRPGQGASARFTAKFDSTPVAGNEQDAGLLGFSDTLTFGYNGTDFGIWYRHDGIPEVQVLQVTGGAGGAENATITVDGTGYTVPLAAGSTSLNAAQIKASLNSQVPDYRFDSNGAFVTAVQLFPTTPVGSFAFASATATASWSQTQAAVEWTKEFFTQANDWNGDYDFTIVPNKLTPYEISFEFLGGGAIEFKAENPDTGLFETVHTLKLAGTLDNPSLRNPSFRIGWASENLAATTAVRVEGASGAGFIEGKQNVVAPSRGETNTQTGVGTTLTNILTIRCRQEFGSLRNLGEIYAAFLGASSDAVKPVEVELVRNATTASPLIFSDYDTSASVAQTSTTSTTISGGEVVAAFPPGTVDLSRLNQIVKPGETLTIAMRVSSGAAADMQASIIWFEDQ